MIGDRWGTPCASGIVSAVPACRPVILRRSPLFRLKGANRA